MSMGAETIRKAYWEYHRYANTGSEPYARYLQQATEAVVAATALRDRTMATQVLSSLAHKLRVDATDEERACIFLACEAYPSLIDTASAEYLSICIREMRSLEFLFNTSFHPKRVAWISFFAANASLTMQSFQDLRSVGATWQEIASWVRKEYSSEARVSSQVVRQVIDIVISRGNNSEELDFLLSTPWLIQLAVCECVMRCLREYITKTEEGSSLNAYTTIALGCIATNALTFSCLKEEIGSPRDMDSDSSSDRLSISTDTIHEFLAAYCDLSVSVLNALRCHDDTAVSSALSRLAHMLERASSLGQSIEDGGYL